MSQATEAVFTSHCGTRGPRGGRLLLGPERVMDVVAGWWNQGQARARGAVTASCALPACQGLAQPAAATGSARWFSPRENAPWRGPRTHGPAGSAARGRAGSQASCCPYAAPAGQTSGRVVDHKSTRAASLQAPPPCGRSRSRRSGNNVELCRKAVSAVTAKCYETYRAGGGKLLRFQRLPAPAEQKRKLQVLGGARVWYTN